MWVHVRIKAHLIGDDVCKSVRKAVREIFIKKGRDAHGKLDKAARLLSEVTRQALGAQVDQGFCRSGGAVIEKHKFHPY